MNLDYPSEVNCKRVGPQLDRIVEQMIPYAGRKRLLDPLVQDLQDRIPDPSNYPEEWPALVFAMLAAASIATAPRRTQGFVRSVQDTLAPADLRLARQWRRVPWAFVAFENVTPAVHDIVLVDPIGAPPSGWPPEVRWDRLPIYSPSLADAQSRIVRSGLALVAYDGTVFHTFGVILQFASFDARDLLFFAAIVADDTPADEIPFLLGRPEEVTSISSAIRSDPVSFLMLFRWQEAPTMTGRQGVWRYCASMVFRESGEDLADESLWRRVIDEGGDTVQNIVVTPEIVGIRLGSDTPMYEPLILASLQDNAIYLRAMTDAGYARGVAAIAPLATMPAQPQVHASMVMMHAAQEILHSVDLLSDLETVVSETFDGTSIPRRPPAESDGELLEDGAGPPDLALIQPVLDLLMEDFNEGRGFTDEMIADRTGAEVEQVRMLRQQLYEMFDRAPGGAGDGAPATAANRDTGPVTGPVPAADRSGLPPGPFHRILSTPVPAEEGVLVLRDLRAADFSHIEAQALLSVPLFRFARWMLDLDAIPATAAGYVAPAIVRQAIANGILPKLHDVFRAGFDSAEIPKKEFDAPVFHRYRQILEAAGLIRLDGKRFVVNSHIKDANLGTIVSTIAEAMFTRVRWDNSRSGAIGLPLRQAAGFLLYVLKQKSINEPDGWVPVRALYDAFLGAHPRVADEVSPDDLQQTASLGWWLFLGIRVNFVALFGETLGILEGDVLDAPERYAHGMLPELESYRVRPSRLFSILFG